MTALPPTLPASKLMLGDLAFAVVGTGRVGTSLALALQDAGASLVAHTSRSKEGRDRAGHLLGRPAADSIASLAAATVGRTDLYVLSVPDDPLPEVARSLADALQAAVRTARSTPPRPLASAAALHTSGATPIGALSPLQTLGLTTFSFHPLQTFSDPATGPERLRGSAVAVTSGTGSPDAAVALGRRLAEAAGARPFTLEERNRTVYHAAACMASNYLVTLEFMAQRLFLLAGLPAEGVLTTFLPLVQGTVDNLASDGALRALTGPLSRGDATTVRRHLETLATVDPAAVAPYKILGLATLELIRARAELPNDAVDALEDLLADPVPAAPSRVLPSRRQ